MSEDRKEEIKKFYEMAKKYGFCHPSCECIFSRMYKYENE